MCAGEGGLFADIFLPPYMCRLHEEFSVNELLVGVLTRTLSRFIKRCGQASSTVFDGVEDGRGEEK